jgi:xylan 1,4-beta-xylosidase
VTVLLTNHTTPGHSIETEQVEIRLNNVPDPIETAHIQRIDADHANPKQLWDQMGQPEYLTEKDVERLQAASRLAKEEQRFSYEGGTLVFKTYLPPHSVAAITIAFERGQAT